MSKEVMQQALEALELAKLNGKAGLYPGEVEEVTSAIAALRAALAEQKCPCGDRPADQCPGEWEPGCDLGANEKYAKVAEQAQPVAWNWMLEGVPFGQAYFGPPPDADIVERAAKAGRTVRLLYTTPPAPQPLTELPLLPAPGHRPAGYTTGLYTADQMRDYARAVEAEMLKRMGVRR